MAPRQPCLAGMLCMISHLNAGSTKSMISDFCPFANGNPVAITIFAEKLHAKLLNFGHFSNGNFWHLLLECLNMKATILFQLAHVLEQD